MRDPRKSDLEESLEALQRKWLGKDIPTALKQELLNDLGNLLSMVRFPTTPDDTQ